MEDHLAAERFSLSEQVSWGFASGNSPVFGTCLLFGHHSPWRLSVTLRMAKSEMHTGQRHQIERTFETLSFGVEKFQK